MTSQEPRKPFGEGPGELASWAVALYLYRQAERKKLLTPRPWWGRVLAWLKG